MPLRAIHVQMFSWLCSVFNNTNKQQESGWQAMIICYSKLFLSS